MEILSLLWEGTDNDISFAPDTQTLIDLRKSLYRADGEKEEIWPHLGGFRALNQGRNFLDIRAGSSARGVLA